MNGGGVPFPLLAPEGTLALPSYAFSADPSKGMTSSGVNALSFSVGGTKQFTVGAGAVVYFNSALGVALDGSTNDVLGLVRGANAQTLRIYGTTTGPKYLSLAHDGTNGVIGLTGGGVLSLTSDVSPSTDNARSLGTASLRFANVRANGFQCYAAAGDAQVQTQLAGASLTFGPGGSGAVDCTLSRNVTNAYGSWIAGTSGTLTGSPADLPLFRINPALSGAFTVTRLAYLELIQPTGAATVTDAPVFSFNAAVGTHKALASSAAVAVTIGSGPTGSTAGNPLGWMKVNVNGTLRYVPFW